MAKPKQAVILRVHRNVAGVFFPWDCVYFFRHSEEALLPKIFPCSLVLDISERFARCIRGAIASPHGVLGQPRVFPQRRKDEEKLRAYAHQRDPIDNVLDAPKNYVAVIPLLHLRGDIHPTGKSGPVYLTARPRVPALGSTKDHRNKQMGERVLKKLMRENLPSEAYFLLWGEKVQPVCMGCPNSLDYLDGKCIFGDSSCYTNLSHARKSDFETALRHYNDYVSNIDEPEVTLE